MKPGDSGGLVPGTSLRRLSDDGTHPDVQLPGDPPRANTGSAPDEAQGGRTPRPQGVQRLLSTKGGAMVNLAYEETHMQLAG